MDMPAAARAKKPRASTARVDAPFCARGHGHRCVPDSHGVSCVRDDRLGSGFPLGVLLGPTPEVQRDSTRRSSRVAVVGRIRSVKIAARAGVFYISSRPQVAVREEASFRRED